MTRFEILDLLSDREVIRGVEVGTDAGIYASQLLHAYPNLHLITVDPWLPYAEIPDDRVRVRRVYKENMALFSARSSHMQTSSVQAAKELSKAKQSFDFVYIDGAHDRRNVAADLEAWWPLVKDGGMFAGHDFEAEGVCVPVMAFVYRHRLDLRLINEYGGPDRMDRNGGWGHPTWYLFKGQQL